MTELGEEHYPRGASCCTVRTGGIAFDRAFGEPIWDSFNILRTPGFSTTQCPMTARRTRHCTRLTTCRNQKIMDVGGGRRVIN
jgi:hypothetical protein